MIGKARRKPAPEMRVACLTMARDEGLFLDIWFRHYSAEFGPGNCFVIDHASEDRAGLERIAAAGGQVMRLPFKYPARAKTGQTQKGPVRFDAYRFRFLNDFKNSLLEFYDIVLFNDIDEILIPDPGETRSLRRYLEARRQAYRRSGIAAGFCLEIFHDFESEPPYTPKKPLLRQRRNFCYSLHYSKPAVIAAPNRIAAHGAAQPFCIDPDLYLLHLKRLDLDEMRARLAPRLEAFEMGEVGQTWQKRPEEAEDMLRVYMGRERSKEPTAHKALLAAHFATTEDGLYLVDSRQPDSNMYLARNAVPEERVRQLQSRRFQLDRRFGKLAV